MNHLIQMPDRISTTTNALPLLAAGLTTERLRNITQIENDNPTFFTLSGEHTFSDVSPTASLSYQIAPSVSTYVTVAQGWKAGGFNRYPSTANAVLPYDAETSLNYEVGLKGAWPEHRLTANLALFYIDIEDQQLSTVTPDAAGVPVTTITNAGKSRSQGVELELAMQPVERLDVALSVAYTDAKFKDFTQRAAGGRSGQSARAAHRRPGGQSEFLIFS